MKRRIRVRNAGGCLRAVIVLGLLCIFAVWGIKALHVRDAVLPAEDGISDFEPDIRGYTAVDRAVSDIRRGDLLLVNDSAPYQFPEDTDLVSLYDYKSGSYQVKDKNVLMERRVIEPLNNLMDDFYHRYQTDAVMVISGYRSYDYQQGLLNDEIAELGEVEAYNWVAAPGRSEHHTGLAFDVCLFSAGVRDEYTGSGDFAWINQNAYRYGFIVRYDDSKKDITGIAHEPWHFRYVGVPHAYAMVRKGYCYEEYIDFLRDFQYGKKHLLITCGGTSYEVYFTKDTEVHVPKDNAYSISGNNMDGFIVTVQYGQDR